jgi:hypothetical protein
MRVRKLNMAARRFETGFGVLVGPRGEWDVAEIELPERWPGVAEPLLALLGEFVHDEPAHCTAPRDLTIVAAQ